MRLPSLFRRRKSDPTQPERPAIPPSPPPPPVPSKPGTVRLVMKDGTLAEIGDMDLDGRMKRLAGDLLPPGPGSRATSL